MGKNNCNKKKHICVINNNLFKQGNVNKQLNTFRIQTNHIVFFTSTLQAINIVTVVQSET
jgi:hypothetical protein